MSARWTENEWLKFHALRFRQRGFENEKPAEFMARKLLHRRKLVPVYADASDEAHSFEVLELWRHTPTAWAAHIDVNLCPTAAELIKTVTDKEEQLLASSISNIARLVRTELQKQGNLLPNARRHVDTHVADAMDDELEAEGLVVDSKPAASKKPIRAAEQYKFPLATNRSNRIPPRPCRHCGSPLHYDRECASWKQQNRPDIKNPPASKASEAYHKSYVAMLEDDDNDFDKHCTTFHALLDTDQTAESYIVEYAHDGAKDPGAGGEAEIHALLAIEPVLPDVPSDATWTTLLVNVAESEDRSERPAEDVYKPARAWERPAGHSVRGVDAFKLHCHVNSLKEPAAIVIGDSGAAPTLISSSFLSKLTRTRPKARTGQKLKLIQLTGSAGCSEYVKLDLYFRSQLGPVCFKGVEAYVVKGMEANMLIGEDTQLAWQLHTIHPGGKRYWKIGDSPHLIPGIVGPVLVESFVARWNHDVTIPTKPNTSSMPPQKSLRSQWNAVAKSELLIRPESIATVTATSRNALKEEGLFLEGIALKRGSDAFTQVPDGIVIIGDDDSFQVKIANTTNRNLVVRAGELIGHLRRAQSALKAQEHMTPHELDEFAKRTACLATLVPSLDTWTRPPPADLKQRVEDQPQDPEHLGWGPKTADPGPDQVYPSDKLKEVIDVDPALEPAQREALFEVIRRNQAAFGFDGRLGHLKSKVHIELVSGTKPISMAPYYASPAKREAIDKQIDLWLSQGVIEESKPLGSSRNHCLS